MRKNDLNLRQLQELSNPLNVVDSRLIIGLRRSFQLLPPCQAAEVVR